VKDKEMSEETDIQTITETNADDIEEGNTKTTISIYNKQYGVIQ
jgi:hypothetical protein